jgi:phosphatidylserine/phosphatidylglycerophosphate/cardiolipin synthase-like enzyme
VSSVGAKFLDLVPRADGQYAAMHAKLVLVDDLAALVTSANFSQSAADRNLEAGVIVSDPRLVLGMREHLDGLVFAGELALLH